MITLLIVFMMIAIGLMIFSIGGTIFAILGADIIVAAFVIWFIFFRKKKK